MTLPDEVVFVIDDDPTARAALESAFRNRGRRVETFASIADFVGSGRAAAAGCIVLDVRLPGSGGFELLDELHAEGLDLPVVFVTSFGEVLTSVRALRSDGAHFLDRPFDEHDLIGAVDAAMARRPRSRGQREQQRALNDQYGTLSARERQVFGRVAAGLRNKQIAAELGVTEKTVKVHRAHAMAKMHVDNLADLVRMAERLAHADGRDRGDGRGSRDGGHRDDVLGDAADASLRHRPNEPSRDRDPGTRRADDAPTH
jgi:FixJ family two-component response regulator